MSDKQITVTVTAIKQVAALIREFTLVPSADDFYPFSPGSHIVVDMQADEKRCKNAYSLLGDPLATGSYRIAVRLQENSRGGSQYLHQQIAVGDQLRVSPPANLFAPHWNAKKHVLIAGGVGITPFMSYVPEFLRRKVDFELHYLFRRKQTGAYKSALAETLADNYFSYDADIGQRCDIAALLAERRIGTHFYICGPESLINAVRDLAALQGVPAAAIHYEEFAAPQPGLPFQVELKTSGKVVAVGAEQSLLEALEAADIAIPNLCRGGVCGQCVCKVVAGEPEHRDSFLSAQEKAAGSSLMPCVSRAKSERLVLEL